MKTLERRYSKSERIIAKGKFSRCVFLWDILLAAIIGGLIAVVWVFRGQIEGFFTKNPEQVLYLTDQNMKWALLGGAGFVVLFSLFHIISFWRREMIITEDKFIVRWGVLNVKSLMLPLNEIKIVESEQNIVQMLFRSGNLLIISDAEKPYKVKNLVMPNKLSIKIMRQITQLRTSTNRNLNVQFGAYVPSQVMYK